jgi:hypothetical protein
MSSPVSVRSIGRFAQAALSSGTAKVIAVFERSAYAEAPGGLACIGVIGNGPLNAVCASFPVGLRVGDPIQADLSKAIEWRPKAAPRFEASVVAASLDRLSAEASRALPPDGFGYLLDPARDRPDVVKALTHWLSNPDGVPTGATGLIGLGPGLTPSGDDLIGGALCALYAAGFSEVAARLADWALPIAKLDTNRISSAHLACAAQGDCGETIHDAIGALLAGHPVDLARIDAIGHTSGWDALAGVALSLHAAVRKRRAT